MSKDLFILQDHIPVSGGDTILLLDGVFAQMGRNPTTSSCLM